MTPEQLSDLLVGKTYQHFLEKIELVKTKSCGCSDASYRVILSNDSIKLLESAVISSIGIIDNKEYENDGADRETIKISLFAHNSDEIYVYHEISASETGRRCEDMENGTRECYGSSASLLYDGNEIIYVCG